MNSDEVRKMVNNLCDNVELLSIVMQGTPSVIAYNKDPITRVIDDSKKIISDLKESVYPDIKDEESFIKGIDDINFALDVFNINLSRHVSNTWLNKVR